MTFVARAIVPEETDQMLSLMCRSFRMDMTVARRIFYADPFYDLSHKRVLVGSDGMIVSCLTLIPSGISRGNGLTLPICGVAGVCTEPEVRGQGYAARLIRETMLQAATEFDYAAAALTAARPDYYDKFGWAVCSDAAEVTLPAQSVAQQNSCGENTRILSLAETQERTPAIREIYNRSVQQSNGRAFERSDRRWRCIEQSPAMRRVAAVFDKGDLVAYAAFAVTGSDLAHGAKTVALQEIVADNTDDERALLGCLARLPSVIELQGFFSASQAARLLAQGYSNAFSQPATAVLMRAIDLEKLVTAITHAARAVKSPALRPASFQLGILSLGPLEQQWVDVDATGELVKAAATRSVSQLNNHPRLLGDCGSITQMLLGYRSARQLLAECRIHLEQAENGMTEAVLNACDALFPPKELFLAPPDLF